MTIRRFTQRFFRRVRTLNNLAVLRECDTHDRLADFAGPVVDAINRQRGEESPNCRLPVPQTPAPAATPLSGEISKKYTAPKNLKPLNLD